jgi:hypothetical protein
MCKQVRFGCHNSGYASEDESTEDNDIDQPDWMDVIKPITDFVEDSDFKLYDGGPDYDWSSSNHAYSSNLGQDFIEHLNNSETESFGLDIPNVCISSLNKEQMFAFKLIMTKLHEYQNCESTDMLEPLRLIIAGTAGCGKSHLIKCLVKAIRRFYNFNKSVQVLCPTGNSANLINGATIHRFLKIPTSNRSKELKAPDGSTGEALQENCKLLKVLLVDERSLIGC